MIAQVLMEVLPQLLSQTDSKVTSLVNMVRMELGNSDDLLMCDMALVVPGYDLTILIMVPSWNDDNTFNFALLFLLHFRLQVKRGVLVNDRTCSAAFLNAIHEPAFSKATITLNTCINNYYLNNDKSCLPAHLCITGLALQLNTMA